MSPMIRRSSISYCNVVGCYGGAVGVSQVLLAVCLLHLPNDVASQNRRRGVSSRRGRDRRRGRRRDRRGRRGRKARQCNRSRCIRQRHRYHLFHRNHPSFRMLRCRPQPRRPSRPLAHRTPPVGGMASPIPLARRKARCRDHHRRRFCYHFRRHRHPPPLHPHPHHPPCRRPHCLRDGIASRPSSNSGTRSSLKPTTSSCWLRAPTHSPRRSSSDTASHSSLRIIISLIRGRWHWMGRMRYKCSEWLEWLEWLKCESWGWTSSEGTRLRWIQIRSVVHDFAPDEHEHRRQPRCAVPKCSLAHRLWLERVT
jgi:hypothetical protein